MDRPRDPSRFEAPASTPSPASPLRPACSCSTRARSSPSGRSMPSSCPVKRGGLKMANGENPKNFNFTRSKMPPATRMKLAAMQREQFIKARDYQTKWATYRKAAAEGKELAPPETDLGLEPLVEVLQRKRTV